jgi:hypothetical protein
MLLPHFTPRKIPVTHFCWRLSRPQGHIAAGRIRRIKKSSDIVNPTRDLLACSIVPQPTTLLHAHIIDEVYMEICVYFEKERKLDNLHKISHVPCLIDY